MVDADQGIACGELDDSSHTMSKLIGLPNAGKIFTYAVVSGVIAIAHAEIGMTNGEIGDCER